jgi:hypothetical protein
MWRRTALNVAGLVLAASALSSCTSTGPIAGQLMIPGQPNQRVTLTYATDRFDEAGRLSVTLPTGESFSGRFVQVTSTSAVESIGPTWAAWGPMWDDWGPLGDSEWIGGPQDVWTFRKNYSGRVVATLFGDRGHMMRCRFRLVNPPGGMADGGTGECQLSSGGKIDAQF